MKQLLIFLTFYLVTYPTQGQTVAVQLDKMNVLYTCVANPITVAAAGVPERSVLVSVDNGTITKDSFSSAGKYTIWPIHPGYADITVKRKTKHGAKVIGGMRCRVKAIPVPLARLAGSHGGEIDKAMLCVQVAPYTGFEGFEFDMRFPITRFTVVVVRGRREIFSRTMGDEHGTRIDEVTNAFFYRLKNGDRVMFCDMMCRDCGGRQVPIESMKFTVTNAHKYSRERHWFWERTWYDTCIIVDPTTGEEFTKVIQHKGKRRN